MRLLFANCKAAVTLDMGKYFKLVIKLEFILNRQGSTFKKNFGGCPCCATDFVVSVFDRKSQLFDIFLCVCVFAIFM